MKKGLNFRDHVSWVWIVSLILYFNFVMLYEGVHTVHTTVHQTWVWCLIGFAVFVHIEINQAYAKRDVARAKDDMKFWQDKAIERQVQIDELRRK